MADPWGWIQTCDRCPGLLWPTSNQGPGSNLAANRPSRRLTTAFPAPFPASPAAVILLGVSERPTCPSCELAAPTPQLGAVVCPLGRQDWCDLSRQWERMGYEPLWAERLQPGLLQSVPFLPHCDHGDPTMRQVWVLRDRKGGRPVLWAADSSSVLWRWLWTTLQQILSQPSHQELTGGPAHHRLLPALGTLSRQGQSPSVAATQSASLEGPRLRPGLSPSCCGASVPAGDRVSAVLGCELPLHSDPRKGPQHCLGSKRSQSGGQSCPMDTGAVCGARGNDQRRLTACAEASPAQGTTGGAQTLRVTGHSIQTNRREL